jgi:hypothetical protein
MVAEHKVSKKVRDVDYEAFPVVPQTVKPVEFFLYWRSLGEKFASRAVVYVYRTLPVVDYYQNLSEVQRDEINRKKRKQPVKNIGKFTDPSEWETDKYAQHCVDLWGAGDYTFWLKDEHPSVNKAIVKCFTQGEAPLRDWDSHPPVLNPEQVVLTDAKNNPYLRWGRANGVKFLGDSEKSKGEGDDEMGQLEVMKDLTGTVERLTDKAMEGARQAGRAEGKAEAPPPPVSAPSADAGLAASKQIIEVLGDATRHAMDSMQAAHEKASKASDPVEYTRQVVEMAKTLTPQQPAQQNADASILKELLLLERERGKTDLENQRRMFELMMGQQDKRAEALERAITELRTASAANPAASGPKQESSLETSLVKMMASHVKDFFTERMGGSEAPAGPWWSGPLTTFIEEGLPKVLDTAATISRNVAAARNGAEPPPPIVDGVALPAPSPQPQQQPKGAPNPMNEFFSAIQPALIESFGRGDPGHAFAASIAIDPRGMEYYKMAQGFGPKMLENYLRQQPELWQQLNQVAKSPWSLQTFLTEFCDKAMVLKHIQEFQAQAGTQPQPAAPPAPVAPNGAGPRIIPRGRPIVQGDGSTVQGVPGTVS